jgi:uridine phosphorylase
VKQLTESELIVNNDGSIYHLGIKPEHLYPTVITVGDPARVAEITKHFDSVDFNIKNREFVTSGGSLHGKQITVLSTGIGTDNIDIVFNELAFLLNFDLKTKQQLQTKKSLDIIRLGTSGSVSRYHPLDAVVYSQNAISFDDLFQFYNHSFDEIIFDDRRYPVIGCSHNLEKKFSKYKPSLTLTAKGFYGPQFRNATLKPKYTLEQVCELRYMNAPIGNIEMETSGIYGLAKLIGFEAISINAILANRWDGTFSTDPQKTIDRMIVECLQILCS